MKSLSAPSAEPVSALGGNQLSPEPQISASQSDVDRRTLMIVGSAAIASVTAGRSAKAALAASEPDRVVALIEAHKLAQANLRAAEAASSAVDRDLQSGGLLFPKVNSLGRTSPDGVISPHTCGDHEDIDFFCPKDMWPEENAREHAELEALIRERDAVQIPAQTAMNEAYDTAVATLDEAVENVPTTMEGVMALLKLQRDLWEMNTGLVDSNHLSFICESVESALLNLRAA
jgi:hypothetical protein